MNKTDILRRNGIDIDKSLEIFGEISVYDDTLKDFMGEIATKLKDLQSYKEVADMANYAIQVHSLKNDAKYFGFTHLAEMAFEHEKKSKENDFQYVYANYDSLIDEIDRILNVVREYLGDTTDIITEIKHEPIIIPDKTIVVVDDSDVIRNFVKKIFDDDYVVLVAGDGQDAINIVENNDKNKIQGILLDLNMPNVDGFQVLDYFEKNNLFSIIPIAIITGNDEKEKDDKAFRYPIVDILKKPFNERDIKSIIDRIAANKENKNN